MIVAEEAKANNPTALRSEIASLKAEKAKLLREKEMAKPVKSAPDKDAIAAAEQRGFSKGFAEAAKQARSVNDAHRKLINERVKALGVSLANDLTHLQIVPPSQSGQPSVKAIAVDTPKRGPATAPVTRKVPSPVLAGGDGSSLTGPQRQLLQSLAWWKAMGFERPTRTQVAAIARWKPKGSNLRNRLAELSVKRLVAYPGDGHVALTPEGELAAPQPDMAVTLIDSIRGICTKPMLALFDAMLMFRSDGNLPVTRDELATHVSWEPGGSNLRNRLAELSVIEVVEYPSKGTVTLQEWVQ